VPDPDPERWREQLKEVARSMRATVLGHRDIVRISLERAPMGPNALRYSERVLAIMHAGGIPDHLAVLAHRLLIAAVNGFTLDETANLQPAGGEAPQPGTPNVVRDYIAALPNEQFPNLVRVADSFETVDRDERFELLLDLLVDGLEKRVAS
jgi:hypothetical protein